MNGKARTRRTISRNLAGSLALAVLLGASPAGARGDDEVRRYVDEEGVVHLSVQGGTNASSAARQRPAASRGGSGGETDEVRRLRISPLVTEAASYYGLPEALVLAVIRVESNFHPLAVSRAGALGLMQLMPGTARAMYVKDPFDPRDNIFGGCRYLRLLINRFDGDLVLVLAAYNAGENAVLKRDGVPYSETAGYVRLVLRHYDRYRRQELQP